MKITSKTRLQGITPEDNLQPALENGNLAILAGTVSGGHLQVDVVSGGGAGEQYADNTAVNAAYKGNLILGTDGTHYQIIGVDSDGHLQVDVLSGGGAGTQYADGAARGTATGTLAMGDDGTNIQSLKCDTNGVLAIQDNNSSLTVDGSVSIASALPAGTNNIGDVDVLTLPAITIAANQTLANVTTLGTITNVVHVDDNGGSLTVDGSVSIASALPAGTNAIGKLAANDGVDIGNVDVPGSTVAHDAVDSGNPHKIGFKAVAFDGTAPPNAAVAESDRVNAIGDLYGRLYVEITHPNYWSVSADYSAAQTNTVIKAAPGAGLSLYITDIVISNEATAGTITLLDGANGSVKFKIYSAINGGCSTNLRTPIKLTANTALCITSTSVTTHSVNISGFIAP